MLDKNKDTKGAVLELVVGSESTVNLKDRIAEGKSYT